MTAAPLEDEPYDDGETSPSDDDIYVPPPRQPAAKGHPARRTIAPRAEPPTRPIQLVTARFIPPEQPKPLTTEERARLRYGGHRTYPDMQRAQAEAANAALAASGQPNPLFTPSLQPAAPVDWREAIESALCRSCGAAVGTCRHTK